jgi:hypothetical protein
VRRDAFGCRLSAAAAKAEIDGGFTVKIHRNPPFLDTIRVIPTAGGKENCDFFDDDDDNR